VYHTLHDTYSAAIARSADASSSARHAGSQQASHPLDALDRALEPLQPLALLAVAALQDLDALLELGARLALRGHHLISLHEELGAELLQLAGRLAQLALGALAQALLAVQRGHEVGRGGGRDRRREGVRFEIRRRFAR